MLTAPLPSPITPHDLLMIATTINLAALNTNQGAAASNTYIELMTREAATDIASYSRIVEQASAAIQKLVDHYDASY